MVSGIASGLGGLGGLFKGGGAGAASSLGSINASAGTSNMFGNSIGSFGGGAPLGPLR